MFFSEIDLEIKKKLIEEYPDGNLVGIYKNKDLDNVVVKRTNELNIPKKEYLNGLGFIYSSDKWGEVVNEGNIRRYLSEYFPDGIIRGLTSIQRHDQKVHKYIKKYCKKHNIDIREYLLEKGFAVVRTDIISKGIDIEGYNISISSSHLFNPLVQRDKYNIELICKLRDEYGCKMAMIAKLLNVSREIIRTQCVRTNVKSYFTGQEQEIEEEVHKIIIEMIKNYEVEYDDNEIYIKFNWYKNGGDIAILYKYKDVVKCTFNPGDEIDNLLEQYLFYKLNGDDIKVLHYLKNSKEVKKKIMWDGVTCKIEVKDKEIRRMVNSNKKVYNMEEKEYYKYIGLEIYTFYDEVEDRLYEQMRKNLDDDGNVKIPNSNNGRQNSKYVKVYKDLRYLNKSMGEMAEYFGFEYKRVVNREDLSERHKSIIQERYIVQGNKIYISSMDKFYNNLNAVSSRKNIKFDQYIESLGFKRIKKEELPDDYVEYDWREEIKTSDEVLEEKASLLLSEISNEKNEVYIEASSYEYETLWKYAYMLDMKINELVEFCGYTRIYNTHKVVHISESNKREYETTEIELKKRDEILQELRLLDSQFETEEVAEKRVKRNKKLPRMLKRLYSNKCQLCSDKNFVGFPAIEMLNGEEYVEVHHIKQLAYGLTIEDDSNNELDSFKNCIVVCCFHHKFLHLHHGGFKNIKKIEGKIYFESEKGDLLEVITNYHLDLVDEELKVKQVSSDNGMVF